MRKNDIKVAIMTWYHYQNYGTALQASALYKVISDIGYSAQIIQYVPVGNTLEKMTFRLFLEKSFRWIDRHLLGPYGYRSPEQTALFTEYVQHRLSETEPIKSDEDFTRLNDVFHAFVCGSDQIWSPLNYDEKYFLSFVKDNHKKIAYAPSMGVSKIDDPDVKHRICELLKDFRYLSVRDKQGAEIIKNLTGQNAKVVLDPTLLLTAEEWNNYADVSSASKLPQPYILCYFLGKPSRYRKTCQRLAAEWGLPIYEIPTVRVHGRYPEFPFEVGPREFVSLIKNAAFVFTDSFHGMVFSVIYRVPFAVFERFEQNDPRNQNSRIYSLMELLNLSQHLVHNIDSEKLWDVIRIKAEDKDTYQRWDKLKQDSLNYLQQSLNEATGF